MSLFTTKIGCIESLASATKVERIRKRNTDTFYIRKFLTQSFETSSRVPTQAKGYQGQRVV